MKGKQINTLCKTISTIKDIVPLKDVLKLIDPAHVMMLEIETWDGSPVFGVSMNDHGIDISQILKIKIGDNEDLEPKIEDFRYVLGNDDSYSFNVKLDKYHDPKIPALKGFYLFEGIDTKKLSAIINQAGILSDFVVFEVVNDKLTAFASDETTQIRKVILDNVGSECYELRVLFPIDYLKKILKVASPKFTLKLDTDYPLMAEWSDEWYKYTAYLAPRLENKE